MNTSAKGNHNVQSKTNRETAYDFLRMAAMLAVIIHHVQCYMNIDMNYTLKFAITDILMTCNGIFFMISGRFLLNHKIENILIFYRDRFVKVILPVLISTAIYYGAETAMNTDVAFSLKNLIIALLQNDGPGYFWFVYALGGIYLATPFLKKMLDACSERMLIILVLQTLLIFFVFNTLEIMNLRNPWSQYIFYSWTFFYILGYILNKIHIPAKWMYIIYAFCLVSYISSVLQAHYCIDNPSRWNYSVSYVGMCSSIYLLAAGKCNLKGAASVLVSFIADISFFMYIYHQCVMNLIIQKLSIGSHSPFAWAYVSLTVIIICALLAYPTQRWIYRPLVKLLCRKNPSPR